MCWRRRSRGGVSLFVNYHVTAYIKIVLLYFRGQNRRRFGIKPTPMFPGDNVLDSRPVKSETFGNFLLPRPLSREARYFSQDIPSIDFC